MLAVELSDGRLVSTFEELAKAFGFEVEDLDLHWAYVFIEGREPIKTETRRSFFEPDYPDAMKIVYMHNGRIHLPNLDLIVNDIIATVQEGRREDVKRTLLHLLSR